MGMKYTQREWDRVVGYGKVPEEYSRESTIEPSVGESSKRSEENREKVEGVVAETKPIETHEIP